MELPVNRGAGNVAQGVIHPPHIPLEAKTESPIVNRLRDTGPGGGLLGDRDDSGMTAVAGDVEFLQKLDRLQILAPAELVGNPFALIAGVVEVEHRGHRIHTQAVDVVLIQPEKGVCDQEVPHLVTAVVEDQRPPVAMLADPRILMLIEGRPVETSQTMCILGEVPGHPVQNHPDPCLVQRIDEMAELVG